VTAYELGYWTPSGCLDTIEAGGASCRGTDVLAEGLSKAELTAWVRRVHESGDGTPGGLLAALGWEKRGGKNQQRGAHRCTRCSCRKGRTREAEARP